MSPLWFLGWKGHWLGPGICRSTSPSDVLEHSAPQVGKELLQHNAFLDVDFWSRVWPRRFYILPALHPPLSVPRAKVSNKKTHNYNQLEWKGAVGDPIVLISQMRKTKPKEVKWLDHRPLVSYSSPFFPLIAIGYLEWMIEVIESERETVPLDLFYLEHARRVAVQIS